MSAELLEYRHALPGGEYMADPDADQTSQSAKDATKAAHDKRWVESRSDIGKNAVGTVPIIIISILLLVLSVAVVVALVQLWPLSSSSTSVHGTHYVVMWIHVNLELESNYFLIVVLAGALVVPSIHCARLRSSWEKESCNGPGSSTTHAYPSSQVLWR